MLLCCIKLAKPTYLRLLLIRMNMEQLAVGRSFSSDKYGSGKKGVPRGIEPYDPCQSCDPCSHICYPSKSDSDRPLNVYEIRKYGHKSPGHVHLPFEPLSPIPSGIFRDTDCETLGLGAGKCCMYKNPEYFSYHHMSFNDIHQAMQCYRNPNPDSKRKPYYYHQQQTTK